MPPRPDVLVIGAGVTGLTTALLLTTHGLRVRIWSREVPRHTTSCAAGALWGPYLVHDPRVLPWAWHTRDELLRLAGRPESGVRLVFGHEAARVPVPPPAWATELPRFRHSRVDELPAGFACGWWYEAPIIDMPTYLDFLHRSFLDAGGRVEGRTIDSLDEARSAASIVVNCTGYGARDLVRDRLLTPTRGQIVVVENPGIDTFFAEHDESTQPVYVLPQGDRVVLGGSVEPGQTRAVPDRQVSAGIRRRCAALHPQLRCAEVRDERVGLRPTRPRVRLQRTATRRGYVIHNYGHGGGGVTLSWGCAREVLTLIS